LPGIGAEAGADVLYAPYPPDMAAVKAIVKAVAPKPVNIVVGTMSETPTVAELPLQESSASIWASRCIPTPAAAVQDAATAMANGDIASATSGMPFPEMNSLLDQVARG
jgi:2-methylisocitrate lyase-like PEP mutase family enzyme